MSRSRRVILGGSAIVLIVAGCGLMGAAAVGFWSIDKHDPAVYEPASRSHRLRRGTYMIRWLGPSHSKRTPFYGDVPFKLVPSDGRAELIPPLLGELDALADGDLVSSKMGKLRVASPGRYRLAYRPSPRFDGQLQIRVTPSHRETSEQTQVGAVGGVVLLAGGLLLARLVRRKPWE